MRTRSLILLLIVIVSLIPAWFFNRYMRKLIRPEKSFVQLLLYLMMILVFVGAYTFLVVWVIMRVFPGGVKGLH